MPCCTECTESWIASNLSSNLSGNQDCDELRGFVRVFVSIIFHVTEKNFFQGSFCTFSKCNLSLTRCRATLYSFSFAKFFNLSSIFRSLVNSFFRDRFFFVIMLELFLWNLVFSFLLLLRFYQTCVDELVHTLHLYYLLLVYQRNPVPYTMINFSIWQKPSLYAIYAQPD